jgi:hypothetical protein
VRQGVGDWCVMAWVGLSGGSVQNGSGLARWVGKAGCVLWRADKVSRVGRSWLGWSGLGEAGRVEHVEF